MELRLRRETLEEMERHALEAYPEECCGLVIAAPEGEIVRRITNVQNRLHAEDPTRYPRNARIAYFMEPKELDRALREAERPGHGLRAFYHSHPDHDAYFSAEDEAAAMPFGEPSYPEASYIVMSVRRGRIAGRLAVAWNEQKSVYAEVGLLIDPPDR